MVQITFPGDFDASGSIVNISINGSADPLEWTKSNGTSFVNISSSTVSANISEYQYINISNITLPQTTGNKTINITTNSGLTISLNYTVVNYSVNLTANRTTANTGETVNATYILILQNNGTGTDTYNLTVSQGGASTAALNVTGNITLASMANQTMLLNVTNTTGSTVPFYVNVTARSNNDTTKVGYINTTTTVNGYSVNLTANQTTANTNETVNATYTLILQNNGTGTDTYNLTVSQGGASTAALNVTGNITLASMANQTLLLNVTNSTRGTFYVNVTARSNNDTTKVGYINTTTTVNSLTGSVNGTVTDFWFSNLQISGVTITLTNTTGGTYSNTTDSSGYYYISGVVTRISDPYIYTISASKANYTTNASATVTVLNSTTNSTTNITLRAYNGTLGGSYIKYGTSIEVSGARVNITNSTFGSIIRTTDSSGSYSVSLYPAIYTINVSKEGYSSNSTSAAVSSNLSTTVSTIPLSPNTVTITANRIVGWADSGQNVSFNLTVVNTGDNATFSVITSDTNANVTNTTTPSPLLLNISNSTGYVVVEVNKSTFGGWPVTITISNSSKSAGVTLTAIMRNSSANYTNDSSSVILNSSVTGGAILTNTNVMNSTVIGAALENTTVQNGANVSGNDTFIKNATVTGNHTEITDGAVIRGDYGNSYIDNSRVGNATVVSSNLTGSTFVRSNSTVTNSTLVGATVDNSTLTNVTVRADSTITNVANLNNITLGGVTVTGDLNYEYEGKIEGGNGWATYQNINFTKVYDAIRISQLVIEQSPNTNVGSGTNISINDTSLGTSMNFSMTVNLTNPAVINISETGISPDGEGFSSGTRLGNFLYIRSDDTNNSNVTSHILRLYFDTDPTTFTEGVAMYYYNMTAPVWEKLNTTASGEFSGRWYIETAPNHFSTYALLGTTGGDDGDGDSGSGSGSGSSGSGGGGGGGKSDENATNIEVIEKYDLEISKAALTSYRFKETGNPIMFVNITGNASIGVVTATVEVLKGTSTLVKVPPDGLVYKNANIWVGTTGMATPKNIKEALIKFKVDNSWMSANGVVAKDIVLVKWDGSSWIKLETKVSSKDDTNTYLEGKTNSFSPFAITATVAEAKTTVTQTPASAVSPTPGGTTPAPAEESDIMTWIIGLIIVVIIGAAVYFLVVKKNE
jgi:PGF-pre-PGF domain-containing protein